MKTTTLTSIALTLFLSWAGAEIALAQQAFETRHVLPPPNQTELAPLPGIIIIPTAAATLELDVAAQLSEAVEQEIDFGQDPRFEVRTRASGNRLNWSFVVRNAPRTSHDFLTPQFTGQLVACLRTLDDDVELAALNVLLQGGFLEDLADRARAIAAGTAMLTNWQSDRCSSPRNDLPFDRSSATLTGAARGMLTGQFDPLLFRGQGLLDLIAAVTPLYHHPGGFWATEMTPRLEAVFVEGVRKGLFTASQFSELANADQETFWDWAILSHSRKATVVRSLIQTAASGCLTSVPELINPFRFATCLAAGRIRLVTLRVNGQNYSTLQRGP